VSVCGQDKLLQPAPCEDRCSRAPVTTHPGNKYVHRVHLTFVSRPALRLHVRSRLYPSDGRAAWPGVCNKYTTVKSRKIVVSDSASCLSRSGGRQCGQAIGCRTMQTRMTRSAGSRIQAVSWFGRRARWFCLRFFCSPYGAVTYLALLQCFSSRCARFSCLRTALKRSGLTRRTQTLLREHGAETQPTQCCRRP
jgi:hypothetical protein